MNEKKEELFKFFNFRVIGTGYMSIIIFFCDLSIEPTKSLASRWLKVDRYKIM